MKSQINKMLKISAFYLEKQKNFVPKKTNRNFKSKTSDFLNCNTCFCSRPYGTYNVDICHNISHFFSISTSVHKTLLNHFLFQLERQINKCIHIWQFTFFLGYCCVGLMTVRRPSAGIIPHSFDSNFCLQVKICLDESKG